MYKVGDLVRILPRIGASFQYRFSYSDEMLQFEGQILRIKGMSDAYPSKRHYKMEDDGKCYFLEGNDYGWASSMFEFYSTQQESYKLNFNI